MKGADRVRAAEQRLYGSYDLEPVEQLLDFDRLGSTARLVEVGARAGSGVPALLFLHGFAGGGAMWASLAADLTHYRCLLLDRPGCGLSELPPGALTNPAVQKRLTTELVADVCDALELASCHLVASSMGGWFALQSAAAHPDRVRSIIGLGYQSGGIVDRPNLGMRLQPPASLLSPLARRLPLPVTPPMVRVALRVGGVRAAPPASDPGEAAVGRAATNADRDQRERAMEEWVAALMRRTDTLANELATTPRAVGLRGLNLDALLSPDDAANITAPVSLFWGMNDLLASEVSARALAELLPDATVEMVDGAGHAPWLDEPAGAVRHIDRHIRRVDRPGAD